MAEFIPTEEEKAAASYMDWDDAALGKFTKHVALTLERMSKDAEGLRKVTAASCAMMLVGADIAETVVSRLRTMLDESAKRIEKC